MSEEYRPGCVMPRSNVEETARSLGRPYRFVADDEAKRRRRILPHYRRRKKVVASHKIEFQIRI